MLYMIGGSPCSGKSTIASLLTQQYGLLHIKLDDLTDQMMDQARANAKPISLLRQDRSPDQIWLRKPEEMADEEWRFYEEIFPYVASYLLEHQDQPLLLEGAGLLPHLVKELEWPASSYLCLTPTADFQKKHYKQREWVPYVLEGTTNPEQAFENWMQRDILFAQMVRKEAMELGYPSLIADGSQSEKQTVEEVARLLKLSNINRIDIKGENYD
ncbi:AAA family ATPase [Streptococcus anginosus]|uniref:AAA family ATPase n=1 Tax=Streptococcus anginosus TaxID=1328 RepID=UPI000D03A88D|nr:AAA family ATPase [Streptococcus anginosus]PRT78087.1 AAA family ATPase [Streptococcus anginosus]